MGGPNDSNVLLFCCKQSKLKKKKTLALGSQTQSGSWAAETHNKVSRAELKNIKKYILNWENRPNGFIFLWKSKFFLILAGCIGPSRGLCVGDPCPSIRKVQVEDFYFPWGGKKLVNKIWSVVISCEIAAQRRK